MNMAHRQRLQYLRKKRAKEREKMLRQEQQAEKEQETSIAKEILGWILYIAIIIGVTYFIVTYVGQRTKVSGDSMESTLQDGDNLIVDKTSYRFRDPKRFEIIVFPYKYEEDTYYIKRIIGLPGETVQIQGGEIYINGEILEESYGLEKIWEGYEGIAKNPITLGEDEYFVLGDNRNHSADSREQNVGLLKRDDLIGRAWIRIWPLDNMGVIVHE